MVAKGRQIVRVVLIVVVALVILYVTFGIICLVKSYVRDRGIDKKRYSEWLEENRGLAEAFDELATREGWKLIVASRDGDVARLDFGQGTYEVLVECDQRVVYADQLSNGLYALRTDSPDRGRSRHSEIVLLEDGQEVARVDSDESHHTIMHGRRLILSVSDRLIYPLEDKVISRDLETGESKVLVQEDSLVLKSACESGGLLYLIMGDPYIIGFPGSTYDAKAKLIILSIGNHYEKTRTIEGVANVAAVGDTIVLQKGNEILAYDPVENTAKKLVGGDLVMACRETAFIYYVSDLKMSIWLYDMSEGAARKLLPSFALSLRSNRDTSPFLSPHNKYLFVAESPRTLEKPPRDDYWWCLYELETGKEVGRFYVPYRNECRVDYVIGWEE